MLIFAKITPNKVFLNYILQYNDVKEISRIQEAWVPLIKLKIENSKISIDFDIDFATFSADEEIFRSEGGFEQIEKTTKNQAKAIEKLVAEKLAQNMPNLVEEIVSEEEMMRTKLRSLASKLKKKFTMGLDMKKRKKCIIKYLKNFLFYKLKNFIHLGIFFKFKMIDKHSKTNY